MTNTVPISALIVRWSARALSTLILLFWTFFLVASLVGDEARSSRALTWTDYLSLAMIVFSLVGLALAWKWELIGAAMTLFSIAACAAINYKVLYFPGTLIPIAAIIYLLSWWWCRSLRDDSALIENPER